MLAGAENSGMLLVGCVVLLMGLSAFFSGTETALMAVNRYRLRHLVKRGNRGARKASKMLDSPDRLLGVILVGNNLVQFSAAKLATGLGEATRVHQKNLKGQISGEGRPKCTTQN